jgi:GntR family histidine utilization transcriptional repressor
MNQENPKFRFQHIKDEILRRIHTRVWVPGDIMPTELELAAEFGCARATVNRAMRELSEEGIIDRRQKRGTSVRPARIRQAKFEIPIVRAEVESTGAAFRYSLVERAVDLAPAWLRAQLGIGPQTKALHLKCMYYADGAPYMFEDRWINLDVVPQAETADFTKLIPNEWLQHEVLFTEAEIQLSATAATESLAEFLLMAPGDPIFTSDRTTWLAGNVVTTTRQYFMRGYRMITRF